MQVTDDVAWQEQLSEFETDDMSRKFRDVLLDWMKATEELLWEGTGGQPSPPEPNMPLTEGISKGLQVTEQTHGYLSTDWIGQMLLVICQHWTHGPELYEGLTFLEKRMVDQATAIKLAELQQVAAKMGDEE